ncbi:hypothetical protein N9C25_07590 [Saprospiraceae bacterium]|nr:hypothetical protein [Saprospiraceae bacterium]
MKKIITFCAAILMTASVFAQAPEKMSYQAVIRDAGNTLITDQAIGMQISILQGSIFGASVYVETQAPNTNNNGLVSIEIGSGTVVNGTFNTIDWSSGPYFIKTETDPTGGTSYTITGTSQLMSVPYALYAENSGDTTKWRLNGDSLYYNNGNVGINTLSPRAYLHVNSGSTKTALLIENTGTTSAKIVLNQAGSANGQSHFIVSRNDGKFVIGNASNGFADQFVLDSLGNVGIGTNSPAEKLIHPFTVKTYYDGSITRGINVLRTDNQGTNIGVPISFSMLNNNNQATEFAKIVGRTANATPGAEVGSMSLQVANGDGSWSTNYQEEKMRLDNDKITARVPLHLQDAMRLEPSATAPISPSEGDIYMDSTTHKLMVYDGTTWQACW